MSDRKPELYVINPDLEPVGSMGTSKIYLPASPADLIAAVRAGVESGTIEGGVVGAAFSDGESVPSIPVTHKGPFLVIPVPGDEEDR